MKINFSTKFPDEYLQLTLLYLFTAVSIDQKQIVFIVKFFTSFSDPYHFYPSITKTFPHVCYRLLK